MTTALIVLGAVLVAVALFRMWSTAVRLDRLHIRTNSAWAVLEGAMARRIVAARALAATGNLDPDVAADLRQIADQADFAPRARREQPEQELADALAALTVQQQAELAEEIADAEERVLLARQFYNDAVRDTRTLRAAWFTRVFRLAGHAPLPEYFQLDQQISDGPHPPVS